MNQFIILVLLLVIFCYCGDKYCPTVLKQNKEILLGVVCGLVLASFGLKLEAFTEEEFSEVSCRRTKNFYCSIRNDLSSFQDSNSHEDALTNLALFDRVCPQYGITCKG